MNLIKKTIYGALLAAFAAMANAQIAGHNVILVHGFQFGDLSNPPSDAEVLERRLLSDFWNARAEARFNWSSAERVEGRISEQVFEQAKVLSEQGTCSNGCVIVLHSTGDQVVRHFLANQEVWLSNAGYEPLDIVATIDLAGAGGGTDLADLAVNIATSSSVPQFIRDIIGGFVGINISASDISDLGVVQDLTYSGARSISPQPNDIPRLRFSGSDGNFIVQALISGANDAVVPASSSCGASSPDAIESCSNSVSYSGRQSSQDGPRGFLFNHFPILMSDNYDHGGITEEEHQGRTTFVLNNFNAGLNVDFATKTERVPWWQFWRETGRFQFVQESDSQSMSALIFNTFNN